MIRKEAQQNVVIHTITLVIVVNRTAACPQDDRVWVGVARSYAMGKVELRWVKPCGEITSSDDLVDSNAHKWVML